MERLTFAGFGGVELVGDAFGSPTDPAVVLLPTAGQARAFWHGSAKALADAGRYAICVDLRGHGDSAHAFDGRYDLDVHVGDVKAVLGVLQSRAVIVAIGLGAVIAIAAAGEGGPQLVSGLALSDATIWRDARSAASHQNALVRRTAAFDSRTAVIDAIAALYPSEPAPVAGDRLISAYLEDEHGRLRWRGDPRALEAAVTPIVGERLETAASRIAAPVTLIRGSLNETVSADALQRLQALIPGSETQEIEGVGHYAATDREEAFNAILLDFLERRVPRRPLEYLGGSEPRVLRDALGCFGTGVTVITTVDGEGAPVGLTANSFTSVSLDPPLILFSLAKTSANLPTFQTAGRFAVNVLHIGQQFAAGNFARRDVPRFESVDWMFRVEAGSPILTGSLASFDCSTYAVHDGGDHVIFIGSVEHAWFEPHRDPLLYFRGKYRRLHFT